MSDSKKKEKAVSRRTVLKAGAAGAAGAALVLSAGPIAGKATPSGKKTKRWGFVLDLERCMGCGACVRACEAENEVPEGFFRTWVERYTFLRDGTVHVDSPDGAKNGFKADPPVDPKQVAKSFFVPKLCNHCEESPCVQVCPVGASYHTEEGVVLVDKNHCVGCGYCVQACPYGCRFLDHQKGYAEKCSMCYHRTSKGLLPACVQACPVSARAFGDLNDPDSAVSKRLASNAAGVLKPELGTHPKCSYIGLDQEVL